MIYVKETDVPKTRTRKAFIKKFLEGKKIPTYSDPEFKVIQCNGVGEDTSKSASYRSISELHLLTQSRFPATSLKALVKIIYDIIDENSCIVLVWCNLINKVVVKYVSNKSKEWISSYSIKNYYTRKGVDGYSLQDYEEIKNKL